MAQDPTGGTVYIFINKVRNRAKIWHWQSDGFALYYKRLKSGTFELPKYDLKVGSLRLSYAHLILRVGGIAITNITRRKRYKKRDFGLLFYKIVFILALQ
ncbi:IS66 family insertion sequence element accessory protein TnpB [Gelidibacter salicanalis]|uniref:IS66 family insertion sequence element accessory protein TnpB n=1 Tax=Gelidibacter salicanalis TaxID=291193 RepID=A0A934NHT4_9FLAO|nr:IS66 family insertion sequence element accessory protein TnpB [Gelidibacter salicanalis]MBJ7880198.1 IS66 family insertion sequence element accessory protein TnpB [Gelidibacter salicanalis]